MGNKLNKQKKNEWKKTYTETPAPYVNFTEIVREVISSKKCIEPEYRMCGGEWKRPRHRFPIKGGISRIDLLAENVTKSNAILSRIKGVKGA